MKEIKDYLHLYLGCDYQDQFGGKGNINEHTFLICLDAVKRGVDWKLILRPLSDMTEEERFLMGIGRKTKNKSLSLILEALRPDEFIYLLSKHFDLFGLIESGLAIDKSNKTIKT